MIRRRSRTRSSYLCSEVLEFRILLSGAEAALEPADEAQQPDETEDTLSPAEEGSDPSSIDHDLDLAGTAESVVIMAALAAVEEQSVPVYEHWDGSHMTFYINIGDYYSRNIQPNSDIIPEGTILIIDFFGQGVDWGNPTNAAIGVQGMVSVLAIKPGNKAYPTAIKKCRIRLQMTSSVRCSTESKSALRITST